MLGTLPEIHLLPTRPLPLPLACPQSWPLLPGQGAESSWAQQTLQNQVRKVGEDSRGQGGDCHGSHSPQSPQGPQTQGRRALCGVPVGGWETAWLRTSRDKEVPSSRHGSTVGKPGGMVSTFCAVICLLAILPALAWPQDVPSLYSLWTDKNVVVPTSPRQH